MPPNYVNKIVHISSLFYQSLNIISASGRKLLKMKNSKSFFNTWYICLFVCLYVCMYNVCMYVNYVYMCVYVSMYRCTVCMYACIDVCRCVYMCDMCVSLSL